MSVTLSPGVIATTFAVIGLAELPDKSFVATLILATRSRPRWVWLGASSAFLVHVVIAVVAGRLISLLPHQVVDGLTAAGFLAGGLYLLLHSPIDDEPVEQAVAAPVPREACNVMGRSFMLIFVGEWGDVTQILTANLTARYDAPLSVGLGAALGLFAVAGLAVTTGRVLLRVVPAVVVRRVAGCSLLVLAALSVVAAVR